MSFIICSDTQIMVARAPTMNFVQYRWMDDKWSPDAVLLIAISLRYLYFYLFFAANMKLCVCVQCASNATLNHHHLTSFNYGIWFKCTLTDSKFVARNK